MSSESPLSPAGLPHRDLRSASRPLARRRAHLARYNNFHTLHPSDLPSYPAQRAHHRPLCPHCGTSDGHFWAQFPADLSTAPVHKFTKREAWQEARMARRDWKKHDSRRKDDKLKWRRRMAETRDVRAKVRDEAAWRSEMWDAWYWAECEEILTGLERYWMYGENAAFIESAEPWTEFGETFGRWARRSICEMRAVREARLLADLERDAGPEPDPDEGYYSSTSSEPASASRLPTTTLPTEPSDIHAHALLRWILTPHRKRQNFPRITGFSWFGEFTWYWHRNLTGCWFVGEYPCGRPRWNVCSCSEFAGEEYNGWDPADGHWRACLEFWIAESTREETASMSRESEEKSKWEENDDGDWDLLSAAAESETWSEVESHDSGSECELL